MSSHSITFESLGGRYFTVLRYPDEHDQNWSAFNPSIAKNPLGEVAITIRSSNYYIRETDGVTEVLFGAYIKTRTWFADVNMKDYSLQNLRPLRFINPPYIPEQRGAEDARLFWRDGSWYMTAVIYEPPTILYARLALYKIDAIKNTATFVEILNAPHENRSEKNWMTSDVKTEMFDYIYSPTQTYKNGSLDGTYIDMERSIEKQKYISHIRGGSGLVLQTDGTYLSIVHDVSVDVRSVWDAPSFSVRHVHSRKYRHYFARYSAEGALIGLSEPFIFKHGGIEFCAGLIEDGENLVLSWGSKDVFALFAVINKDNVINTINTIDFYA